jgi:carboxylesterase type B
VVQNKSNKFTEFFLDLVQQAILESGTINTCFDNTYGSETVFDLSFQQAQALCNYTKEELNSKNFTSLKTCLMNMDYHEFLKYPKVWTITVDGNFLPDFPDNLWKKRRNIPIIMGTNKDECSEWCKLTFLKQKL